MTVEERVKTIIVDKLSIDKSEVNNNENLIDDLGADSLDLIELIMDCEKEFIITIPDEEVENIKTVNEVVEYIKTKA